MPVPESLKKKYSLNGDQYPARDADRAIQDLIACITRLHSDNEATGIRAANAESKVAALEEECDVLKSRNIELEKEADELRAANQRLTAEAERLDKKLVDLGVSVSANDKKLAEAYDRLAALITRAETLCGDLDDRSAAMCRTIEARTEALCRAAGEHAAPVPEAQETAAVEDVQPSEEAIPVTDTTETESAEAIPELEIEEMPDDELGEDTPDPNLFTEIPGQDTEQAGEQTADSSILNALKNAIGSAKAADAAAPAHETGVSEPKTEAETETASSAEAVSMTDDDIKNMLAAMYSDGSTTEESSAEDKQDKSTAPGSGNEAADEASESSKTGFGNMKSSLDAIRRRLGK